MASKPTRYPIYILSRGRWESRLTSKTYEEMGIPYRIVVEDGEYDKYAAVIDPKKIIALPTDFREDPRYAIKDEAGLCGGGIPARNFIWEHSIKEGWDRHHIQDDNIRWFYRLHKNTKLKVKSSVPLRVLEDFTDRFENVKMSGFNYDYFAPSGSARPAFYLNTRVYSCIMLSNDIKHRWRGKYNEDTDLSLRILKDGHCTILLNAFLAGKITTLTMKGGNTEEIYKLGNAEEFDNRYKFAKSLYDQHPDMVEITQKWGRFHHHVRYDVFKQKLKLKEGIEIPREPNEYGLKLVRVNEEDRNIIEEELKL